MGAGQPRDPAPTRIERGTEPMDLNQIKAIVKIRLTVGLIVYSLIALALIVSACSGDGTVSVEIVR